MKNIVLPTDFSDNAWNAIFTVLKMYHSVPCHFHILHAYEPKAMNLIGRKGQQRLGIIYDSLAEHSKQELKKILEYLNKNNHNDKHTFETISKSDSLINAIQEVLVEKDIDLICMGTQGATGAKEIFMGSNTVKVLKQIDNCPLLVVPTDFNFLSLKSLIFATDFTKRYEKHQLSLLTELATLWETEVQVVHVAVEFALNDQQEKNRQLLDERFEGIKVDFQNVDFVSDVEFSLEKYIDQTEVDLVALIRYQHTFWEKVTGEPVVKKMTFHAKVPLLVLPE